MNFDYFGGQIDPNQFRLVPFRYFLDVTLNGNQTLNGQQLTFKGAEMFFAIMRLMSVSTGAFRVKLYDTSSRQYTSGPLNGTSDLVRGECMYGTASRPAVLPVPIVLPGSSSLQHDILDVSGAGNTLHLVYEGVQMYPK